jgi:hypothetical protein
VHPRAVVAEERLGHEGHALAVAARRVLEDVLEPHELVAHLHQRTEAHVDLALTAGRHLVVLRLDGMPSFSSSITSRAQVDQESVGGTGK